MDDLESPRLDAMASRSVTLRLLGSTDTRGVVRCRRCYRRCRRRRRSRRLHVFFFSLWLHGGW
jgi:hypothetical protein